MPRRRCGLEHVEILGHHQLFAQRLAQVVVVVDKKDFPQVGHGVAPLFRDRQMRRRSRRARFATASHADVSPAGLCFNFRPAA
jgi:hypothetical protein